MAKDNELTKADLDASLAVFAAQMDEKIDKLHSDLTNAMRQMETDLLTEFHRYRDSIDFSLSE
jgi:hypothetical protein